MFNTHCSSACMGERGRVDDNEKLWVKGMEAGYKAW